MHPQQADLELLATGSLDEKRVDELLGHLDLCPQCQDTVERIESEKSTWLRYLKQPAAADPLAGETACINLIDIVAAIGRSRSEFSKASADEPDEAFEIIGQYKLLKKLGQGGMGAVYKALHTRLEKVVALKVLPASRLENEAAIARFDREMKAVGKLNHPNIVAAHDAGDIDGTHFLVMEVVDGEDLSDIVQRTGPLSIANACEIVRQAAVGLQHACDHGLVHRDIKPSNLMLSKGGQIKILDMGLALLDSPLAGEDGLTSTGQMMGTVDYMAPEQVTDSHTVDIRADVYSLGCTMYRLLSGVAPFDSVTGAFKKATAHVTSPIPPLTDHRSDVPRELLDMLDKMLAKSPDKRFQKPADLAAAIEPFANGHNLADLLAASPHHGQTTTGSESPTLSLASGTTDTKTSQPSPIAEVAETYGQPRSKRLLVVGVIGLVGLFSIAAILLRPPANSLPSQEFATTQPINEATANTDFDLTSGLVGYWNFEEGEGTQASDSSGNGNHGTLLDMPYEAWTDDTPPSVLAGQHSLRFQDEGRVEIPDSATLDVKHAITIAFWVKRSASNGTIMEKGYNQAFALSADSQNARWQISSTSNAEESHVIQDVRLKDGNRPGEWTHHAVCHDGREIRWFVNGELLHTEPILGQLQTSDRPLTLGNSLDSDNASDGLLDDIRIYDRALSEAEISELAGVTHLSDLQALSPSSAASPPSGVDLTQGLVAHWNFTEGQGTQVKDVSGRKKHGSLMNTDATVWSSKGPPSAFAPSASILLDGTDDDLEVPTAALLNGSNEATVSIWINPRQANSRVELLHATSDVVGFHSDGRFLVTNQENKRVDVTPRLNLPAGQWHHLAGRYDGRSLTVFRDGNPVGRETHSGKIAGLPRAPMVYRFGGRRGTDRFFDGSIADVRIYDRALTDYEIAVLAGASTQKPEQPSRTSVSPPVSRDRQPNAESSRIELNRGLVGHWNFEEGEGTQASDSSGNDNHGTLTDMDSSAWIKDAPPTQFAGQSSLRFDGVDDYVLIADSPSLNPERAVSIAFWRKMDADGEMETPFFSKRVPSENAQYAYSTVGRIDAGWKRGLNRMTNLNCGAKTRDGHWHHEVVIIDEGIFRIYFDGSGLLHGSSDGAGLAPSTAPLTLGCGDLNYVPDREVSYFRGQLDDLRIYNRVLSEEEIAVLAGKPFERSSSSGIQSSPSVASGVNLSLGLVVHWNFESGEGAEAVDSSGNEHHGNILGGVEEILWSDDVPSSSWAGNHSLQLKSGSVELRDDNASPRDTVSIALWYKLTKSPPPRSVKVISPFYEFDLSDGDELRFRSPRDLERPGVEKQQVTANNILPDPLVGKWRHVALSASTTEVVFYVDGKQAQRIAASSKLGFNEDDFRLLGTNALVDDVRVYNRMLNDEEVAELARVTTPSKDD